MAALCSEILANGLIPKSIGQSQTSFTRKAVGSIDFLGCILLLAASILLVFALQEGGAYIYAWDSPTVITALTVAGVAFLAFVGWQQWLISHPNWPVKVIFPIKIAGQRVLGSALLYIRSFHLFGSVPANCF